MISRIRILTLALTYLLLSNQVAYADTRFGVGLGVLYNGLGINTSASTEGGLAFASLGCIGFSTGSGSSGSRNESTCGIGGGFLSTSLIPSKRHTLGIVGGLNYDTDTNDLVVHVTPSYVFFFNGIENRGLNLGLGSLVLFRDGSFDGVGILLNIGYHF